MRNVPAEVRATMAVRRNFVNYATVTLADGTVLNLQPQDFRLNGNEFTDELVDGSDFQVGSAIGKSVLVRLDNSDERFSQYDFYKAYFYLYVHLPDAQTVGTSVQDGIFNIGKFTVLEPETSGTIIEFSGVDEMYKFDLPFDNCSLDFSTLPSMYTILARCCTDCGVAIGFDNTFDNANLRASIRPEGVSYREVVSYVCQIAGMNAKINTFGALVLQWYDMSPLNGINLDGGTFNFNDGDNADGGSFSPWSAGYVFDGGSFAESTGYHNLYNLKQLRVATDDIQFTGVRVVYEETVQLVGTEAYALEVKDNPFTAGRESTIATFLYNKLNGLKFRPFSCSYLQDPSIESGDPVMVYDVKGNAYKSIITNVTFSTGGYMSLICNAKDPVKQASTYRNPAAQAVVEARRNTKKQIDSYASTVDHFNEIASDALGYYKTEVIESGATITYLHDQPTLASSTYVIKITGQGIYISEDGGETYTSGYDTTTATLLLNLVYVHGITADWVTSGIFQDKHGNFVLDVDNGTLKLDLTSEVGTGTTVTTTLGGMISSINANAQAITLKVSKGDVSSQLSVEQGTITLSTGRLRINSGNFQLDANGTMTCVNANIKGTVNIGYASNQYGVLNIYGPDDSVNPIFKLDNTALTAYSKNYNNTYQYITKYAQSGYLNQSDSSTGNYVANAISYYVSGENLPFAFIGILGKSNLSYQDLHIRNKRKGLTIETLGIIKIVSENSGEPISSDYNEVSFKSYCKQNYSSVYYYERECGIQIQTNTSDSGISANNKARIQFKCDNIRVKKSDGTTLVSPDGSGYIDRLGYHGNTYGTHYGVIELPDDTPKDASNIRIRVYSGGDWTEGYYRMTFKNGILTDFYLE